MMSTTADTWTIWVRQSRLRPWRSFQTLPIEDEAWRVALWEVPPRHERLVRLTAAGDPNVEERPR
jgi:hypothetical protein